jgi:hypothetical protein
MDLGRQSNVGLLKTDKFSNKSRLPIDEGTLVN